MELELVERARAGDRDAFTELASAMADRLYTTAFRIVRDTGRAEDATQHALLTAWRRLPSLRDPARFDAWMHRLLINACHAELGKDRRWDAKLRLLEPTGTSTPDIALSLAMRDELERAFSRLSADHRAVIVLRHFLFWSTDEIADTLSLPVGTVASRLHYGLNALRAALEAEDRTLSNNRTGGVGA